MSRICRNCGKDLPKERKGWEQVCPKCKEGALRPCVVHCKKSKFDVYIGRPSKWGNPFNIGVDGTRADVISKYESYLLSHPNLIEDARIELKGKILGCWCSPLACHGDVLVRVSNE